MERKGKSNYNQSTALLAALFTAILFIIIVITVAYEVGWL